MCKYARAMQPPTPSTDHHSQAEGEQLELVDGLIQLSFLLQEVLGRIAAGYNLSIIQTRLLGVLRDREPGMLELARILGLEKSSLTGLVERAERRGLVQRTTIPADRRAVRVVLTQSGRDLVNAAAQDVRCQIETLAEGLTDTDRRQLAFLAGQIVHHAADARGVDLTTKPPGSTA